MEVRRHVNKSHILDKVNQFDIFKHYNQNFKEIGKKFCSELRQDRNPTCIINRYGDKLYYRDFGVGEEILDCFDYIMKKFGVSFHDSLEMVNLDFNLGLVPMKTINHNSRRAVVTDFDISRVPKAPTEIKVKLRKWTLYDKAYWFDKYGITSAELKHFKVYPLEGFWIRNSYFKCLNNSYGYYFGLHEDGRQSWKIYQPNNKDYKWFSNCLEDTFQGFDQLPWVGDRLIITKSMKDVIILYKLGIPAIAPQGETVNITVEFMNHLKKRFKSILLLYDNDGPGQEATANIVEQHHLNYYFLPEGTKDPSDFVEMYGIDQLKELLNSLEW